MVKKPRVAPQPLTPGGGPIDSKGFHSAAPPGLGTQHALVQHRHQAEPATDCDLPLPSIPAALLRENIAAPSLRLRQTLCCPSCIPLRPLLVRTTCSDS